MSKMRVYHVGVERYVQVEREYAMKFGRNIWYVSEWAVEKPKTLFKAPTLTEALSFVRELKKGGGK